MQLMAEVEAAGVFDHKTIKIDHKAIKN